jgi:hypothetical protein
MAKKVYLTFVTTLYLMVTSVTAEEKHWSLQPMKRAAVPAKGNPIDYFISQKLREQELKPSPEADRATLIRRATLDLTGLPPSPQTVKAFLKDPRNTELVFAEAVDELLASPRYGERWAQHWLDVVRYADTHGFEVNTPRANAWPYRDYVIRAFNEDKPYNQFAFEQIAGDSVGEQAGTGFLVAAAVLLPGQIGKDEASKRAARQDSLDEIIVGTCDTFLGLTVGCARCHDHKFDPITQKDYYAMQAFFAGVTYGERQIETDATNKTQATTKLLAERIQKLDLQLRSFEPDVFSGRTILIDDEDSQFTTHLKAKEGHGSNPDGTKRGYVKDPGDEKRLPNLSRGRYTWWKHKPGEDVFTYNPTVAGKFRIWISWGAHGSGVHTRDACYVIDRDGNLKTKNDQKEIAKIDQYYFSGISKGETEKRPLWSGIYDAGPHELTKKSRIILRGGKTGMGITADVIILQESLDSAAKLDQPHLRAAPSTILNIEKFEPVKAKYVRMTFHETMDNFKHEPCIDELEVFSTLTNSVNLARTQYGTKVTSSGAWNNSKHKLHHINDGQYGNDRSFISSQKTKGWVQLEFKQAHLINRIEWARDRNSRFRDRLAIRYTIQVGLTSNNWQTVATEKDRMPFGTPFSSTRFTHRLLSKDDVIKANKLEAERKRLVVERDRLTKPRLVYSGKFMDAEPTYVLHRGNAEQRMTRINARVPSVLGELGLNLEENEQNRRVALAKWITSSENPLTARVMANRIWQFHFGTGIVSTSNDFGLNGAKPSHPELLDWLATEFIRSGWSIKHMHKLIMLSDTYQQSNRMNGEGRKIDADTRLLWRFPSRRLEAEAIRDSILFVSGNLNLEAGGPGFSFFKTRGGLSGFPPVTDFTQKEFRRMIYQHKIRMEPVPVFGAFDAPDAGQSMPHRKQSTTAIQALNLFNSPFVNNQAITFSNRVVKETGEDTDQQITRAFQLAFGRQPKPIEAKAAIAAAKTHGLATLCRVLFNSNEFLFLP